MLNAAVPMEAYDADEFTSNMVDSAWSRVPLNYRASDWNKLFLANLKVSFMAKNQRQKKHT